MRRIRLVAAVAIAAVLTLGVAVPAGAAGPWQTGQVSTGGNAFGIACATSTRCYAITGTRITTRDGNTVTSAPAPMPPGADPSDQMSMRAIACPAADSCLAVGTIYHQQVGNCCTYGLVEQISSTGVVASEVPPSAGFDELGFSGLSCPAPGACSAVGTEQKLTVNPDGSVTSHATPIYAHQAGAAWVIRTLPVNAGSLSCPTATWCAALSATTILTLSHGQIATRQAMPTPAGYFRSVEVDGLDCPSVGNCTFVGLDRRHIPLSAPRIQRVVVGILHAGVWRVRLTDLPGDAARGDGLRAQPTGLSCPGVTHCVAVGEYATTRQFINAGLIIRRAGDALSVRAAPLPAATGTRPPSGQLNAISCASVTSCDAVGPLGGVAVDDVWNGTSWHSTVIPSVTGQPMPSALEFDALACPAVSDCFATGGYAWRLDEDGVYSAFTEAYAIKS